MRYNKKGLSDIVTTTLIILLVAVAVAAIWAFVGPALKGTGTQFNKAQTCIANQIDVTACTTSATSGGTNSPIKIQVRRTLTDNVANLKSYKVTLTGFTLTGTTGAPITSTDVNFITSQGQSKELIVTYAGIADNTQAQVTAEYENPDGAIIVCQSLPLSCQKPS